MRSRRDGSRWRTTSSESPVLPQKLRQKRVIKRFRLHGAVNHQTSLNWRPSYVQMTPHSSSAKRLLPMEVPLRSCLWSPISAKSLRTPLAEVTSQAYRKKMLRELIATLKAVGKSTELHQTDDGTRLLILPYGGRILDVFAPGSEENFMWTHSALNSVEPAPIDYASDVWQSS